MTTRTSEAPPPLPTTRTTLTRVRSQAWHPTPEAYRKSWKRCPRHAASGERRQRTTKRRESTAPASRLASESLILRAFSRLTWRGASARRVLLLRWVGRRARQAAAAVLVRPTCCSRMCLTRRGKIVYRMERFRQSIGRCYLEFSCVLLEDMLGVFSV